jgi:hypothetical protein
LKILNLPFDFVQDGELVEPVYAVFVCASPALSLPNGWLKIFQPKILNYAKQTQFPKCQKCFKLSKDKELQQIMICGLLCKTNPIKPNLSKFFTEIWYSCPPKADLT